MACVRVDLDHAPYDGETIKFKAPCDCTAVNSLRVYYPVVTENSVTTTSAVFSFRDAHKNDLQYVPNLFAEGAYVSAILDTTNKYAFLQNADNNGFLSGMGRVLFNNASKPLKATSGTTVDGLYRYNIIAVFVFDNVFMGAWYETLSDGSKVFRGDGIGRYSGNVFANNSMKLVVTPNNVISSSSKFSARHENASSDYDFSITRIIGIC